MKKYTFIAEYKGGTYISQYIANNLTDALLLWGNGLDKKIFSKSKKDNILLELNDPNFYPTPLKDMDKVWCSTYLSGKTFLLLNIIEAT